ncbi:leucine-rich repeat-containing protein 9-like [Vespula squamosa]|uniref:Leucine-rich repeat-containing protein 9-like n=1 Tax=Vespula squamosa TaxID=30214 RepID=A0ABD1ZSW6_VESSQ
MYLHIPAISLLKNDRSAFRTNSLPGSGSSSANNSLGRSLRNDLLVAADSVTNAMSTLVRELNSDSDQEDHSHNSGRFLRKPLDFEAGEDGDDSSGGGNSWREELQRRYQQENDFLAELRARNVNISQTERTSAASSSEQEQDRGDREEAEGGKEDDNETDWSEAVKRWPIVGVRSMFHSPPRFYHRSRYDDDTRQRRKCSGESSLEGDEETPRVVFFSRKLGAPRRLLDEIKRMQVGYNRSAPRRDIFERSLETHTFARIMADRVQAKGDISSLKECTKLEKLYVYSNEIERIPNLSKIPRLAILSLSGNNIDRLTDIKSLRPLEKLESVVFNDPLYGDCPMARLCNYRSYVVYWLPRINRLDHYPINDAERHWIDSFFKKKMMRCKVLLQNNINVYFKSLKDTYEKFQEKEKRLKKLLHDVGTLKLQRKSSQVTLEENSKDLVALEGRTLSLVEYHDKKLKEREEMASLCFQVIATRYIRRVAFNINHSRQITCRQLKLHMRHCGNVYLREYKNNGEGLMKICQTALEKSLCPFANESIYYRIDIFLPIDDSVTGITGILLYRVTEVFHKEISEYRIWNDQMEGLCENEKCSRLLAIVPGVQSIREWPMNVLKGGFYNQKRIRLTNCSAIADPKFHEKFSKREKAPPDPCEKRRVSILLRVPFHRCTVTERYTDGFHRSKARQRETVHRPCQVYVLTRVNLSDAIFVAEYEYVFENDPIENDRREEIPRTMHPASSPFERLTKRKISLCLKIDEEKLLTLRKISLAGQGIKGLLEDSIELPNLREIDLSYNRLDEFPNWRMIVYVKKMNVSFNDIRSIKMKEKLSALEELDISWNSLTKCRKSLETLKAFAPSLKSLNLERNPFSDIVERDKIFLFTGTYFPGWAEVQNLGSLDPKVFGLKVARNTLAELHDRHPTISISHSSIGRVQLKKPSVHLVRLHLTDNCITDLDGLTQEHFPKLKYLDLTNNLITSLRPMGSYNTIIEFYCAHNDIRRLQEIENLKSWQKLQVVDLSYNPNESAISYKNFLIFHLVDLKYVSGQCVEKSSIAEARNVLGNILDQTMLLTMNLAQKLTNVRQLDVVRCSIKKINLPSNLLPHLESLDLSRNHIISLESLNTLPKLKTLRMSYNRLETLQLDRSNDSDGFPNLSTLYLDHNRIGSITLTDHSHIFPTLKHLFLHHNRLADVYGLRQNSTLEILIIDHNNIETMDVDSFHENNNIACLSIESNKIQDLRFVKRLPCLKKLHMADNLIANENELDNLTLLTNLEELTLLGNPLSETMNYYKFALRSLARIKSIDGYSLSSKTCGCNDLSIYECISLLGQNNNVNKGSKNNNNNNVMSQDNGPKVSPISDLELQRITEDLFQRNSCCIYKNITVSYQGWIKGDNITDNAPKPLLKVSSSVFSHPTIKKLSDLFDNYELDIRQTEVVTRQESTEEDEFIDTLASSDITTTVMNFLATKGYFAMNSQTYKTVLKSIWFHLYSRIKGSIGSSGFEHVFLVEKKKDDTIVGLHNWIFFAKQESLNNLNYLGYGRKVLFDNKAALAKLHFNYKEQHKASTMFIGTLPELDVAIYTLCFYARPNAKCRVSFAGHKFNVQTYTWQRDNQNFVGAAFPLI